MRPYLIVTACIVLYCYPFLRVLTLRPDEGWCITDAVRVYHGQLPFRDFFEIVGPITFYWVALFFKLFGVTWMATRACVLLDGAATALLVYFLARRLNPRCGITALLFWMAVAFPTWPAVNHHFIANLLALAAFALQIWWLDFPRFGVPFFCGMIVGVLSFTVFQKGVLLGLAFVVILLLQRGRPRRMAAVVQLLAGIATVVIVVTVFFAVRGGLPDLIYANFTWPLKHYGAINAVPYGFGFARYVGSTYAALVFAHPIVAFTAAFIVAIPLAVIVLLPLIVVALGFYLRPSSFNATMLPYWVVGFALWISEAHRPDTAHLVLGSPVLIVLWAYFMHAMGAKALNHARRAVVGSLAILAGVNLMMCVTAAVPISTSVGSVKAFARNAVIEFTNSHVKPGETIFVYPFSPIYYFLSGTSNPTRYSYLIYGFQTRAQMLEVVNSLERDKTKYILWDTAFETVMVPAAIPPYRPPRDKDRVIEPYINEHYKQVGAGDGYRFMERKSP